MTRASNPKTVGFNARVLNSTPGQEEILLTRKTPPGHTPEDRPIYWGSDDTGTLSPSDNAAVHSLIPAALSEIDSRDYSESVAPEAMTTKSFIVCISFALVLGSIGLFFSL
jgi:hypothetical protein